MCKDSSRIASKDFVKLYSQLKEMADGYKLEQFVPPVVDIKPLQIPTGLDLKLRPAKSEFIIEGGIKKSRSVDRIKTLYRDKSTTLHLSEKPNLLVNTGTDTLKLRTQGPVQVWQIFDFVTAHLGISH